jgi:hypothetical protein
MENNLKMSKFHESNKKFTFIREVILTSGKRITFEIARTDLIGLTDVDIDFDKESDKLIEKYKNSNNMVFEYVPNFGFDISS